VKNSEVPFAFDFEGAVVSGRIDLVRRHGGSTVEIVDFKTTELKKGLTEQTELQLDLYALGASEDLDMDVGTETVHFLSDSEERSYPWKTDKRRQTESLLANVLHQIRAGRFEPRPEYCPDCHEFRAICPYRDANRRRSP
jgi:CRISPR/Cas system-associated exonuclease Cas4 (RecB family)